MKGSDVYLDCDVKANPPIKKVEWYHSVSIIFTFQFQLLNVVIIVHCSKWFHFATVIKYVYWLSNVFHQQNNPLQSSRGVIITNQTLVLQSISKQTHGQYMCRATNAQGSVSSNDLYLDVKCE